jgi:hypothetical protein
LLSEALCLFCYLGRREMLLNKSKFSYLPVVKILPLTHDDVKACMGWSEEEEPVFVLEDGTVLIYSMFGIFKTSFSMGQEAKDIKILGARYSGLNFLNCNGPMEKVLKSPFWIKRLFEQT